MLKRILCVMLCLMMVIPAALAETADTLPKRFVRQLSGGNGARGYISVKASGVAEWLDVLMPFTATDIQVRAIGQKQGDLSESVTDDDEWQVKFYAKDAAGQEAGTTWLFGDPKGMYFKSELLPDTLLSVPVEQVHLLYQLFKGEFSELFFAFDPMELTAPAANGNTPAYQGIANILGIDEETWTAQWLPVLEKYFQHLELWLVGYGESSILNEDAGKLTMSASYTIPADEFKTEAKYIIGQMMYDNELQELLIPHVTMEQRITYLNPQMVYFYEACIDAMALEGDITMSREMSALGEVVSTTISLPLPGLPEKMTAPVNAAMQKLLALPYADLIDGVTRLTLRQNGTEKQMTLQGEKRAFTVKAIETVTETGTELAGTMEIIPGEGVQEQAVTAAFTTGRSHRVWQDEKYLDHDTVEMDFSVSPVSEENAAFKPVSISLALDYRNNPNQQDSPVQVNLNVNAELPDALIAVEAVMRITTQLDMEALSPEGAKDAAALTEEEAASIKQTFMKNAALLVANLYGVPVEITIPEPTAVPPVVE
ncbi:MAG: hypothetical protein IJO39_10120 [Clostridia bacterium]|nr:hypothetical protein [Clostridia bacterium]